MDGDYLSIEDLEEVPLLSEILNELLLQEEKEEDKKMGQQVKQCVNGQHGRIVECDEGTMCSVCGRIAYYRIK